jgi:hypothetical protein
LEAQGGTGSTTRATATAPASAGTIGFVAERSFSVDERRDRGVAEALAVRELAFRGKRSSALTTTGS